MTSRLKIVIGSAIILVGLFVIVILSVVGVTHTGFGQTRVRQMVLTMLEGNVKGKVYIGHMSGGFFTGVTIDSVEIKDDEDSVFFASGPITVEYDPRDLFDRRILLSHLEAEHPVVHLRQHENGDWNWRRIFPASVQKQKRNERGFGEYIVVDSSVVRNAGFTLTLPWHPSDTLRGAKRDSALKFELTRTDHEIRRTREGLARTWRWSQAEANLGLARIADPDTVGRLVRIRKLSFAETDPPFKFRNISGTVLNLGDSVFVDTDHFDLPGSTGKAHGSVVWGSDLPIRYYLHVVGDSVSLADVAWVYPTLPTTGGGKMELDIRSERNPRFLDYILTKMDVRTTRSRLLGQMTFGTGADVLAVKNVDLQAAPVDFDLLRTLNGKKFPYDWQGKITGNVRASGGPLNHFKIEQSALIFEDAHAPVPESVLPENQGNGVGHGDTRFFLARRAFQERGSLSPRWQRARLARHGQRPRDLGRQVPHLRSRAPGAARVIHRALALVPPPSIAGKLRRACAGEGNVSESAGDYDADGTSGSFRIQRNCRCGSGRVRGAGSRDVERARSPNAAREQRAAALAAHRPV